MKGRFEEIYQVISGMKYSQNNFLELISLVKEAENIARKIDPDRRSNPCLNNIVQTYEKQIEPMMEKGISKKERQAKFEDALTNFKIDLHMFCME